MNNFMMKISNVIPEWLLKYLKKREIESEEVNFKVTKAIHFLSSYTFYFVQLKNTRNLCKYMWQLKYQNNL